MSALLINDQHEVGTHRGAVNKFSLFYVKTGIFSVAEGKLYSHLQKLREDGDYNCSIDIDEEDIVEKVTPTRMLIDKIVQNISDKQLGVCSNMKALVPKYKPITLED